MANTKEKLKEIMALVFECDADAINEHSSMDNLENWDSLRHLNLVLAIEDEFGITLPDEEVGNLVNFQLLELVINEQLGNS